MKIEESKSLQSNPASKSKSVIVLPTFNEIENLEICLSGIQRHVPAADIFIVDDNSPDGTGDLADQLAKLNPKISVLHRASKEGLGRAYLSAFEILLKSNYETIVQMDVDGSHRPEDLPSLLEKRASAPLVIGSRWIKGGSVVNWPIHRHLLSRFANKYAATLLRIRVKDSTAGFRAYSTELLSKIDLNTIASQGYSFQIEMTYEVSKLNQTIKEVPITFLERQKGHSKMSRKVIMEAMFLVLQLAMKPRTRK